MIARQSSDTSRTTRFAAHLEPVLPARQLGDILEMSVTCDQEQVVLQREGGDPEIIVGDRRAGALELNKQTGVVLSRLPIREQNPNRSLGEQLSQ
jgi:hypothetical protein